MVDREGHGAMPGPKRCEVTGCDRPFHAKGLCYTHYRRLSWNPTRRCELDGCDRPLHGKGLCCMHYTRLRRSAPRRCEVDGCPRRQFASGLCAMHYKRVRRFGSTDDEPVRQIRSAQSRGERNGLRIHPERAPMGERNSHAKLSGPDDVRRLRSLYATGGFTLREVGALFGVGAGQAWRIVHHKAWRHVD